MSHIGIFSRVILNPIISCTVYDHPRLRETKHLTMAHMGVSKMGVPSDTPKHAKSSHKFDNMTSLLLLLNTIETIMILQKNMLDPIYASHPSRASRRAAPPAAAFAAAFLLVAFLAAALLLAAPGSPGAQAALLGLFLGMRKGCEMVTKNKCNIQHHTETYKNKKLQQAKAASNKKKRKKTRPRKTKQERQEQQ